MIKGLSDRRRLPRLGKIRLGVMVQEPGKRPYPRATDHFVVPPEVEAVYGPRPTELPILFPLDNPEILFPQSLKMYRASGLFCAGDGVTAKRWNDAGALVERDCPCPFLDEGDCSPVATLTFLLPDVPGIGVWQLSTSNKQSITGLNSALELYRASFGGLAGIPFVLQLEPADGQRFDEAQHKMVKTKFHVLRLAAPEKVTWRQLLELRGQTTPILALLPPPSNEEPDDLPAGQEPAPIPTGAGGSGGSLTTGRAEQKPVGEYPPAASPVSPSPSAPASPGAASLLATSEWTLETCFEAARCMGAQADDYRAYLLGVYSVDEHNLPGIALLEQIGLLRDALRSPAGTGAALVGAIRAVADKVRRRRR